MADLVREGDVIGMGGPGHARLLRRGAVHGMEIVGNVVAAGAAWVILHLTKGISRAGDHRTTLPGGIINDISFQPMRGIM